MQFNSLGYLFFLPVTLLVYAYTPVRWRWAVLLSASYLFYAALKAPYLLIALIFTTLVAYWAGRAISGAVDEQGKKARMIAGVLLCLSILLGLKYLPVFATLLYPVDSGAQPVWISIGVSFFVFQAVSYIVDTYLEKIPVESHLGYFALYMSFFPKLLQGPIERGEDFLPQIKCTAQETGLPWQDYTAARGALLQIGWGLFKKLVLAERLAVMVNAVYNNLSAYTGLPLILATYLFALQIYFDFAGYTDIALGSARLFGIRLTPNFNHPYLAASVAEFWRRWHISFSRWILDYIFKPLQFQWRRMRVWGTALALLVTFLISGIWHGAQWGFVIWGLLHGAFLSLESLSVPLTRRFNKRWGKNVLVRAVNILVTFNLVSFAWIFFRANSLGDAWYVVTHLFNTLPAQTACVVHAGVCRLDINALLSGLRLGQTPDAAWMMLALLAGTGLVSWINARWSGQERLARLPLLVRWGFYYLFIALIIYLGIFESRQFLYNQF